MWLNQINARDMTQILRKFQSQGMLGLGGTSEVIWPTLHLQMKRLLAGEGKRVYVGQSAALLPPTSAAIRLHAHRMLLCKERLPRMGTRGTKLQRPRAQGWSLWTVTWVKAKWPPNNPQNLSRSTTESEADFRRKQRRLERPRPLTSPQPPGLLSLTATLPTLSHKHSGTGTG